MKMSHTPNLPVDNNSLKFIFVIELTLAFQYKNIRKQQQRDSSVIGQKSARAWGIAEIGKFCTFVRRNGLRMYFSVHYEDGFLEILRYVLVQMRPYREFLKAAGHEKVEQ